jgi:hypothetical protein
MMEELRIPPETPEKEITRSIQILAGVVLAAFTLLCGFASVTMLVVPNKRSSVLAIIVAFVLLLGSVWVWIPWDALKTSVPNPGRSINTDDMEHMR